MSRLVSDNRSLHHDPTNVVEIDWSYWRDTIQTPGFVDWLKAESDACDFSDYGFYHMDDLTPEARTKLLEENSLEVAAIGKETIEAGIRSTVDSAAAARGTMAKETAENAGHWLEQLYQDREQLDAEIKGQFYRTQRMSFAEHPYMAREAEEMLTGNPWGNGQPYGMHNVRRTIHRDKDFEDNYDQMAIDWTIRENDEAYLAQKDAVAKLGFSLDIDKMKTDDVESFLDLQTNKRVEYREEAANVPKDAMAQHSPVIAAEMRPSGPG